MTLPRASFLLLTLLAAVPDIARADERLCDASFENCRDPLLALIRNERVGIDVAFWFMEDARYSYALIERFRAGVPVRVLIDSRATPRYPANGPIVQTLADAGIPMIDKAVSDGIVHWKMMLFAGQQVVQFSGANYSPHAFRPVIPYVDYIDEVICFSDDPGIVQSFMRAFDSVWVAPAGYVAPFANVGERARRYPIFPVHPDMNFQPVQDFAGRSVALYDAETQGIDTVMFRITDLRHTHALLGAVGRGVRVRIILDEEEYRDPERAWHAYNVDLLYAGGVELRTEAHLGALHQKSTVLHAQQTTIFGSANWTPGPNLEHSIFTAKPHFYSFFSGQFERKWNNATGNVETRPFTPLPPDAPAYVTPANAALDQPPAVTLAWNAGLWAHKYDIYFGTNPTPPLVASGLELGPSESATDFVTYDVAGLAPGITYYWRVVSRTMAGVARSGPVWSFRTEGGGLPGGGPGDVVLYAARAEAPAGRWRRVEDSTAAGGAHISTPDNGVKVWAQAEPADYFELTFQADAGVPYRLWVRGKANRNRWSSDSAYVQFSGSVDAESQPVYRIGTASATPVTIEDCSGCGLSAWGWNDNAYGLDALGPEIYFESPGEQRLRVQMREDGLAIDQIVLSRDKYLAARPGAVKDDGTILQESSGRCAGCP